MNANWQSKDLDLFLFQCNLQRTAIEIYNEWSKNNAQLKISVKEIPEILEYINAVKIMPTEIFNATKKFELEED